MNHGILYVGVDVHEKESQLAVLEKEGPLLLEMGIRSSLRVPVRSVGPFTRTENVVSMQSING